jgi:tRNA A37 methylthiotransferase MiaB
MGQHSKTLSTAMSGDHPEEAGSQAVKVQLRLREMILAGELTAGSRITELAMVESMARDGIHLQCRTENGRVALINAGSDQAKRLIGQLMPVKFTEAMPHSLRGELMIQE